VGATTLTNSKGMGAQIIALVSENIDWDNRTLHVAWVAGAASAVQAVKATCQSHGPFTVRGIYDRNKYRTPKDRELQVFTGTVAQGLKQMMVRPDGDIGAPYEIIDSLTSESREEGLYDVFRLYTRLPILQEWADTLFKVGQRGGLVTELKCRGAVEWAYHIKKEGWDQEFDRLAKSGEITIPSEE